MKDFARRKLLRGVGGIAVGLPALDVFRAHEARAQGAKKKVYSVFMMQANGVAQAQGKEPEQFWPTAFGPLSDATMMGADAVRATSELAGFASKLTMVKVNYAFPGNGCGHTGGCNQAMTAAKVSSEPRGSKSLAMGESLDNRIARELTPGREPLALYVGPKPAYIGDAMSYRGPLMLRAADNNPWTAYQRLIGLGGAAAADPAAAQLLVGRRKSVNDALRAQLRELQARKDLSMLDRQRLDLHFSSIRDLELAMTKQLGPMEAQSFMAVNGKHQENDRREAVARLMIDIVAFAFASDAARTATLQIGTGNDGTQYTVGGVKLPPFHQISHRIYSDGADGAAIPDAVNLHHQIDRIHARMYKAMLTKFSATTLPEGGSLLDSSIAVWMNSLSNGPPHSTRGVPWILGGSGGGFFKTGQYINVGSVNNNKLFNSILTAVGVRGANGAPIENFGDPSLPPGMLTAIHA
jgi:hypothetical protein